jgi:hypothetical protein
VDTVSSSYNRQRHHAALELSREHRNWRHPASLALLTFGIDVYQRGWSPAVTGFVIAVAGSSVLATVAYALGMYAYQFIVGAPKLLHDRQQSLLAEARSVRGLLEGKLEHREESKRVADALRVVLAEATPLLNVQAPSDPSARGGLAEEWIPRAQAWDAKVIEVMVAARCAESEIEFVRDFVLGTVRTNQFIHPMNSQWTISHMRCERLQVVLDNYLEQPLYARLTK